MIRLWIVLALCVLAACSPKPEAKAEAETEADAGVCWRGRAGARVVVDRPIGNLETCAARLEAVRMMEGGTVEGAFEGRSIFVSEAEIVQAASRGGTRYPVFTPGQRSEVQAAIRRLLDRGPAEARR